MNGANDRIIEKILISKSKNSAIVFFNTGESISLNLDIILKYKLNKGIIINCETHEQIIKEERLINVKQKAYNYVSYKRRSEKQIIDRLIKDKFDEDEIKESIKFLNKFNFIDDKKFARDFVSDYLTRKSSGKAKLKIELIKKGIDKYTAEDAIKEAFPEDDAQNLINKAIEKKMRTLASKPIEKQKNSLISYLQRQGFEWALIKNSINGLFDGVENDDYYE